MIVISFVLLLIWSLKLTWKKQNFNIKTKQELVNVLFETFIEYLQSLRKNPQRNFNLYNYCYKPSPVYVRNVQSSQHFFYFSLKWVNWKLTHLIIFSYGLFLIFCFIHFLLISKKSVMLTILFLFFIVRLHGWRTMMAVRVGHFVLPGISIEARGDNYWLTLYNNRQEESPDLSVNCLSLWHSLLCQDHSLHKNSESTNDRKVGFMHFLRWLKFADF